MANEENFLELPYTFILAGRVIDSGCYKMRIKVQDKVNFEVWQSVSFDFTALSILYYTILLKQCNFTRVNFKTVFHFI